MISGIVWFQQAERDVLSAKNSFKSSDYYVAALLCQQAVEKALKFLFFQKRTLQKGIFEKTTDNIIKTELKIPPLHVLLRTLFING